MKKKVTTAKDAPLPTMKWSQLTPAQRKRYARIRDLLIKYPALLAYHVRRERELDEYFAAWTKAAVRELRKSGPTPRSNARPRTKKPAPSRRRRTGR
jgi:hypothetical protein